MGYYPNEVARRCTSLTTRSVTEQASQGIAASFECGCYTRFALAVNPNDRAISDAAFGSNGCGFMVAAAQVLAEYVGDRSLTELHGLDVTDLSEMIEEHLGTYPASRQQCAKVAIDALRNAFAQYRAACVSEYAGEVPLICTCFGVSEITIDSLISNSACPTVEKVMTKTRAGSGCGSCRMLIQEMIDSHDLP